MFDKLNMLAEWITSALLKRVKGQIFGCVCCFCLPRCLCNWYERRRWKFFIAFCKMNQFLLMMPDWVTGCQCMLEDLLSGTWNPVSWADGQWWVEDKSFDVTLEDTDIFQIALGYRRKFKLQFTIDPAPQTTYISLQYLNHVLKMSDFTCIASMYLWCLLLRCTIKNLFLKSLLQAFQS